MDRTWPSLHYGDLEGEVVRRDRRDKLSIMMKRIPKGEIYTEKGKGPTTEPRGMPYCMSENTGVILLQEIQ